MLHLDVLFITNSHNLFRICFWIYQAHRLLNQTTKTILPNMPHLPHFLLHNWHTLRVLCIKGSAVLLWMVRRELLSLLKNSTRMEQLCCSKFWSFFRTIQFGCRIMFVCLQQGSPCRMLKLRLYWTWLLLRRTQWNTYHLPFHITRSTGHSHHNVVCVWI